MARGFGVAAALAPEIVRDVAAAAEEAGYQTFWVNDTPGADGLERLAAAAAVTRRIGLGVGVAPLDRRPPEELISRVRELGLPRERLILGVGSGRARIAVVRAALPVLAAGLVLPVVVGALGPRMCRLAGEAADGVLFNWLTPVYAKEASEWVLQAAEAAGRPRPRLLGYVRTALAGGMDRLRAEADRYAAIPAYAEHFERMGVAPVATGIAGDADTVQHGLDAFDDVLDEVTVRAITPNDTPEELLALLRAAAPRL